MEIEKLCDVLKCCDNDDDETDDDYLAFYVGVAMFVVSEVLPFIGVKANGILHMFMSS